MTHAIYDGLISRTAFSRCFHLGFETEQKAKDADQRLQVMDDLLKEAMGEELQPFF